MFILIFNHDLDLEIQAHETSHWLQAVFLQSLRPGDEICSNRNFHIRYNVFYPPIFFFAKEGFFLLTLLWTTTICK